MKEKTYLTIDSQVKKDSMQLAEILGFRSLSQVVEIQLREFLQNKGLKLNLIASSKDIQLEKIGLKEVDLL